MEGNQLSSQEMKAIQETLRQGIPRGKSATFPTAEASLLVLSSDDRAADQAKPNARQLGLRWAKLLPRSIAKVLGVKLDFQLQSTEISTAGSLREELEGSWLGLLESTERPGVALVCISGPMLCSLVVKLLGGELESSTETRATAATLRLFGPLGEEICEALSLSWRESLGGALLLKSVEPKELWRKETQESELMTAITLSVSGAVQGSIRLFVNPQALILPREVSGSTPAAPRLAEEVLSGVPVEVSVPLGAAQVTMSQLASLRPGEVIPLDRFLRDPLPICCAGIVKGYGRVVMLGEALALEIIAPNEPEISPKPQKGAKP